MAAHHTNDALAGTELFERNRDAVVVQSLRQGLDRGDGWAARLSGSFVDALVDTAGEPDGVEVGIEAVECVEAIGGGVVRQVAELALQVLHQFIDFVSPGGHGDDRSGVETMARCWGPTAADPPGARADGLSTNDLPLGFGPLEPLD